VLSLEFLGPDPVWLVGLEKKEKKSKSRKDRRDMLVVFDRGSFRDELYGSNGELYDPVAEEDRDKALRESRRPWQERVDSGVVNHEAYDYVGKWDPFNWVVSILGEGKLIRSYENGKYHMTVYEFPRRDKLGTITITFQDEQLLTKEQTGP
jgi:hypothetical protein